MFRPSTLTRILLFVLAMLVEGVCLQAQDPDTESYSDWQQNAKEAEHRLIDPTNPEFGAASCSWQSLEEWARERPRWSQAWREHLGAMPTRFSPPHIEVLDISVRDGLERHKLRIEVEPGIYMDAILLVSATMKQAARSLPGIVALHPTVQDPLAEITGERDQGPRAVAFHLAKQGYVVLSPKCFLWQDTASFQRAADQHRDRHPNTKGMAKMLHDAQCAVDALVALPFVDPHRIGTIGHSLGAKEVLYLMAFDARVRVGVASEGGLAYTSTNWDAPWYLGASLPEDAKRWDHAQLLALIAPRPLLVMGGESGPGAADGSQSLPVMEAALPVWKLFGDMPPLGLWNHRQGHFFGVEQWERSAQWLDMHLR